MPAPKKIASKKKTISEDIDAEKPAKKPKIGKKVLSDSSDFDERPPLPREKAGGNLEGKIYFS